MKVSKSNVFALVNSIGRDLAGALEITTGGMPTETSFRNIPMSELQERVKKRAQQPIGQWDGKPRLSIAAYVKRRQVSQYKTSYTTYLAFNFAGVYNFNIDLASYETRAVLVGSDLASPTPRRGARI